MKERDVVDFEKLKETNPEMFDENLIRSDRSHFFFPRILKKNIIIYYLYDKKGGVIMDIFNYADSIGWAADYMDMHTGLIYAITRAYTDENGKKVIPVYENGILIGTTTDNR